MDSSGELQESTPIERVLPELGVRREVRIVGIRVAGRSTQGVIIFDTAEGEKAVAVERISDEDEEDEEGDEENGDETDNEIDSGGGEA